LCRSASVSFGFFSRLAAIGSPYFLRTRTPSAMNSIRGGLPMPREKHAPRVSLRAIGLINEAEQFASALGLIGFGVSTLGQDSWGGAIGRNASEISKRLEALKSLLRPHT
jgi:hypothetical protein